MQSLPHTHITTPLKREVHLMEAPCTLLAQPCTESHPSHLQAYFILSSHFSSNTFSKLHNINFPHWMSMIRLGVQFVLRISWV